MNKDEDTIEYNTIKLDTFVKKHLQTLTTVFGSLKTLFKNIICFKTSEANVAIFGENQQTKLVFVANQVQKQYKSFLQHTSRKPCSKCAGFVTMF